MQHLQYLLQFLEASIEDGRLSSKEKRRLARILSSAALTHSNLEVIRKSMFDLASHSSDSQATADPVTDWLFSATAVLGQAVLNRNRSTSILFAPGKAVQN